MKEVDPDFTKNRILDALNRIQYHRIEQNYAILARKILIGDKNEIYTILQYILKDSDKIRDAVYLSKWARGIAKNAAFSALKFNSWNFQIFDSDKSTARSSGQCRDSQSAGGTYFVNERVQRSS